MAIINTRTGALGLILFYFICYYESIGYLVNHLTNRFFFVKCFMNDSFFFSKSFRHWKFYQCHAFSTSETAVKQT